MSENVFTYLVTPQFKLSRELMVYARASSGYRPGGSNGAALPGQGSAGRPAQYNSDKLKSYELGLKADTLEHRLVIDTSLYYVDFRGLQLSIVPPPGRPATSATPQRLRAKAPSSRSQRSLRRGSPSPGGLATMRPYSHKRRRQVLTAFQATCCPL